MDLSSSGTWSYDCTELSNPELLSERQLVGGGVVIGTCFAATGPEHLAVKESTMSSSLDQKTLESNMRAAVQ